MTDFDQALENCLDELATGASSLEECLLRHPEHAAQLKPILLTAARLEQGREVKPSAAFKARARAKLTLHMQAHPRKRTLFNFTFKQLATSLTAIVLALVVTGTAYAQGALPGDSFYSWKLASEYVWRAVAPDKVNVDLVLANRRIDEMNAVINDPVLKSLALKGYQETVTRLNSELDAETLKHILPVIEFEQESTGTSNTPTSTVPVLQTTAIPSPEIIVTSVPPLPTIIPTIEIPLPLP